MNISFPEASQTEHLYRQIIDNAPDALIAIDDQAVILDWNERAHALFGWSRDEALGMTLDAAIIPERHRGASVGSARQHLEDLCAGVLNKCVQITGRRKDGTEIPVELTVTPISASDTNGKSSTDSRTHFLASVRACPHKGSIEEDLHRQAGITAAVLNSVAGAIVVADASERLVMVNPAGQRLFGTALSDEPGNQSLDSFSLFLPDGKTLYPAEQRPIRRALRGEHVDRAIAFVRRPDSPEGIWLSINARPLRDSHGALVGGVAVFHDITELRRREEELRHQARVLHKQASLLDLAHDAIFTRTTEDVITYWNRSAEKLYRYSREEALGKVSHELLKSRFPIPLEEIRATVQAERYWEGEVVQTTRDGKEIVVFSQWALEFYEGQPYRYLEINADITQRRHAEHALLRAQEDLRLLVEASTDHAIIMLDPDGKILSWNTGAEKITGLTADEAIGRDSATLFTPEDRAGGEPQRELQQARDAGRADDDRWHLRRDGTRFWAAGVVTPLWNPDGSLRGFAKIMRDQTAQRLTEEKTQFLASHDGLTGLANRVAFSNHLHQAIAVSERTKVPLALLLLDLDRFKQVNDTFGHHTGDLLLREVAMRIASSTRETDFVARLGGDEFVIIQCDVTQPDAADTLARKLVLELGRPYDLEGREVLSGTSVGVCLYPADARNSVELLKRADLALYRAKHAGRHTYQFYTPDLITEQNWKKDREAALRAALENHQFELYYQPQVDLREWSVSTVEALLRWNASEMETVLPGEFLEIAEQSGLIVELGEWALREACRQVRSWRARGLYGLRLSVNCSARQFNDPRFVGMIPSILEDAGMPPSALELEVPEALLAKHPEIKEQLSVLRVLGIRLTIDNFGTGATALVDLKDFGIDALKIDKSFVQHLPHRREDAAITSAIINLAHNLGVSVSAGGVETAEQLAYLKARDCTSAQGFLFSAPLPAAKMEELMQGGGWSRLNRVQHGADVFRNLH